MSALPRPPKADIRGRDNDVCFVPKADIGCSLSWRDILIHAEQVCRIVALLDLG